MSRAFLYKFTRPLPESNVLTRPWVSGMAERTKRGKDKVRKLTVSDSASSTITQAPGSSRNFDRLKTLLREMFHLDRGDLDFGLYRIMNLKAGEIEAFLEHDLLPQVKEVLAARISDEDRERIENRLNDTIKQLTALKAPVEDNETVLQLRKHLEGAKADAETEADVYGLLANFFARYYNEGDFMSLRRYSGGGQPTYLIPYDGEEVKLHWANADQYYVKTTENYASYAFAAGEGDAGFRVRFEMAAADNEKDNVKEASGKQRRFVLTSDDQAVTLDGDDLVVRFEHRPLTEKEKKQWPGNGATQQGRIDGATTIRILAATEKLASHMHLPLTVPAPTTAHPERTLLAKHVERYTAKNSFDYFIHKDLGGFLRRELDLYLKTDVLNLDDLALGDADRLRRALARMRAVRHVAEKIIAFLAQLEEFQKRLWLKKKFVLETQWCVTLDRVPEALYPEIAANEVQRKEWVALFAINKIAGDLSNGRTGYSEPLGTEFLKANPCLVLDTRHFNVDFKDRLLAALSDAGPLEEQVDGLLAHSENFQALNLLRTRYAGQVNCIYIDPPYNTDASPIIYKNGYKSSTWNSLIENGLRSSKAMLTQSGVLVAAIDDEQHRELNYILSGVYQNRPLGTMLVRSNPSGRPTQTGYSVAHEYLLYAGRSENSSIGRMPPTDAQRARFSQTDTRGMFEWRNLRREGSNSDRAARRRLYYPIYIGDGGTIRVPDMEWDLDDEEWIAKELPNPGEAEIFPDNRDGAQKTWRWEADKVRASLDDLGVRKDSSGRDYVYYKRRPHEEGVVSVSCWFDGKYSSTEHGTSLLKNLFGRSVFSYPKSIHAVADSIWIAGASDPGAIVLDYFAGSGTTGHAVFRLNRADGGRRKFVLVEMGDHFDTVMLPRLKKALYSPDWKDGKPVSREQGASQILKYVRLESYEDALDGLKLTPPDSDLLAGNDSALTEDYRLRYALGSETASSPCLLGKHFTNPFGYTLSVVRDGIRRETPADLPETFNYLLGLHVEFQRPLDGVLTIAGKNPHGQWCLVLWRDIERTGNASLNRWFAANREQLPTTPDLIYVNGDHTLNAIRQQHETWTAEAIEPLFRELMFEEEGR